MEYRPICFHVTANAKMHNFFSPSHCALHGMRDKKRNHKSVHVIVLHNYVIKKKKFSDSSEAMYPGRD